MRGGRFVALFAALWVLSISQAAFAGALTLAAAKRTAIAILFVGQSVTHGNFPLTQLTGSISGNVLTVSVVAAGQVEPTSVLSGANIPTGLKIVSQVTGTALGVGTYQLSSTLGSPVSSQTIYAAFPQGFASLRKPYLTAPLPGAQLRSGGSLFRFIDDMWDYGYDVKVINAAKGSSGLVADWVGQMASYSAYGLPNVQRFPINPPDRGDAGDRICFNGGPVWVAIATPGQAAPGGNARAAMNAGPFPAMTPADPNQSNPIALDYAQSFAKAAYRTSGAKFTATISSGVMTVSAISSGTIGVGQIISGGGYLTSNLITITSQLSGTTGGVGTYQLSLGTASAASSSFSSLFDFRGHVIGDTVLDGGITWRQESTNTTAYGGGAATVFSEAQAGIGFDRFGLLQTAFDSLNAVSDATDRYVYIDGFQNDLQDGSATAQAWRQAAVQSAATFFLSRGVKVIIGNMIYSPGSGTMAAHVAENAANLAAYNALAAGQYGSMVFWGADLYASLGTNLVAQNLMTADQIHLDGAGSMLQGDAYAAALMAILGKPGFH